MDSQSPASSRRMRLSASRTSISGRKSISGPGAVSALPRATGTSIPQQSNRLTSQPTYDFIAGENNENEQPPASTFHRSTARPPSRQGSVPPPMKRTTLRQSMAPKTDSHLNVSTNQTQLAQQHQEEVLGLRAKVNSLEYELKNLQSERGLLTLQHEKELREAQARADADYARYQSTETEKLKAMRAVEASTKDIAEMRDRAVNEKTALERKAREAQSKYEELIEDKEDVEARFSDLQREYERFRVEEVEGKRNQLERTLEEVRADLEAYKNRCESAQKRLEERESDVERLEKRVMEMSSSTGGGEELDLIKRELGEQVAYVRRLEGQVREQNAELRKLRDERRSVNVVEEEKRTLETEVQVLKDAERRLGELEIQKEILEDEKRMWTSLLEKENGEDEQFESPEAVVKALVNERIEHALVVDRLGSVESELIGKDEAVRALEAERNALKDQVAQAAKSSTSVGASTSPATAEIPDNKAYKRLDRHRQLAVKEVEYLRAQLKTFDTEETMMMTENVNFDNQRSAQIKQLESLVDQYRSEIQTLHTDLSKAETGPQQDAAAEPRGVKRPATGPPPMNSSNDNNEGGNEEDRSDQVGALLRKNKNLQALLQKQTKASQMLATDLQATKSQLKALRASKSTRVLELRDNPTAQAEAVKLSTIRTLKAENEELMRQIRGDNLSLAASGVKTVPASALDAVSLDLQAAEVTIAERDKRMRRQREIWTDKAAEFRDVIQSILGYRINFMPNGKVKISSIYYNPPKDNDDDDGNYKNGDEAGDDNEEEEEENYILFDGEKGTMKISGPLSTSDPSLSSFRTQVETHVEYWVKEKKEIPLFLAAMSMDFFDKYGPPLPSAGNGGGGGGSGSNSHTR